jgi:phage-related protein
MTEAAEKLSGKLGLDTTDFKTGVQAANRELRVLESSFRAGVATLGDWSASSTGLEARVKSLTGQMDIQKLKVAALREEYERVKTEKGENSRAAQDLEIKLNKETETLGKMEAELGQTETALTEMTTATEESGSKAEEAGGKWDGFKTILGGVGAMARGALTMLTGLAVGAVATIAAVGGLVFSSAAAADGIADMSVKTGISVERLQEMKYAGDQLGVSLETITGAQYRLTRAMAAAQENRWGDQAQTFKDIGVSVVDAAGNLRSSEDVFNDVITALGGLENPAEADAIAMSLFGRSAQELNPLIRAGTGELARLTEEARKNGAVVSTETIGALAGLQDQLDGLKGGLLGVGMTLAGAFAPLTSGILGEATGVLQRLAGIVTNFAGTSNFAPALAGLFTDIVKDIATSAPQMLTAGLGIIQTILTAIKNSLPTLLTAATDILTSLLNFIVAALPIIIPMGIQILLALVNAILTNLPMLIEAALQAIIALATGLAAALPELIPAVMQAIITIVQVLIENLPLLVDAALQLILALTYGLIAAIPILVPAIPEIMNALVGAIILALPMIADAALQIIFSLATALTGGKPDMGKSGTALVDEFVAKMKTMGTQIRSIGKFMVEGIWEGIKGAYTWLYDRIKEFIDDIIQSIMDAGEGHSPMKKFYAPGKFAVQGFVGGMFEEAKNMERQMGSLLNGVHFAPAFASGGGSSNVVNNNGNSLTINGLTFPGNDMNSITLADVIEYISRRG